MLSVKENIEHFGRFCLAYCVIGLFFLLDFIHIPLPLLGVLRPSLILIAVYYWSIYRPTLLPPLIIFCLGIITDFLSGLPTGLSAFLLLGIQWLVSNQRRFLMGQPFGMLWLGFGIVCCIAHFLFWGIIGALRLHWSDPMPVIGQTALSIMIFPLTGWILFHIHRILPEPTHKT